MDFIRLCPDSVLSHFGTFLRERDWSNFANLSHEIAFERNEFWVELHRWKFNSLDRAKKQESMRIRSLSNIRSRRHTRSGSNPRLAFFNALRNRMFAFDHCANLVQAALRKSDSPKTVAALLLPDFPINRLFAPCSDSTILCSAVKFGRWRVVKLLTTEYHANLNIQDHSGMNPLLIAAWSGDLTGVKLLLSISHSLLHQAMARDAAKQSILTGPSSNNFRQEIPLGSTSTDMERVRDKSFSKQLIDGKLSAQCGSFTLDFDRTGCPSMSSVCGGRGPYTARVWAYRKSIVCPENKDFGLIVKLLNNEMKRQGYPDSSFILGSD